MRNKLGALRELRNPREALLFIYLTAFAAAVPLLLRLPLPRFASLVTRPPRTPRTAADPERLERLVRLAARVCSPLVRTGCLTRGVTLFWFLRRAGFDVELRFGLDVADPGEPDGHCWLALNGEPFLEKVDPRPQFAELYRLPLRAA
jgi:hypothetical protein